MARRPYSLVALLSVATLVAARVVDMKLAGPSPLPAGNSSTNDLFPLPNGFKIMPDLDAAKQSTTPGAKMVKIRQGPFKVPAGGMVSEMEQWIPEPEMPCRDCYITAMQGTIEFADGNIANPDDGVMLQVCTLVGHRMQVNSLIV